MHTKLLQVTECAEKVLHIKSSVNIPVESASLSYKGTVCSVNMTESSFMIWLILH